MVRSNWVLVFGAAVCVVPQAAQAQRADENAVRAAEDAFGSSIGNESIGLYSPYDVRGFSPFAAGNVRLEGLYYDAVAPFNGRLIRGSTVRVGISAQGYPFPAPTGIADYRLRLPGDHPALSVVGTADSWGGTNLQVDGQTPLIGDKLSLAGGAHLSGDKYSFDGGGVHASGAAILRYRPTDTLEIIPFWSTYVHFGMENMPIIIPAAAVLPPRIERSRYLNQHWAKYKGVDSNAGAITRWHHGSVQLDGGIFRSVSTSKQNYVELFTGLADDEVAAHHLVSAAPPQKFASTSGELRGSYSIADGDRLHTFTIAARAREGTRRYGGSDLVDLGTIDLRRPDQLPEPDFSFGPYTRDRIRQKSIGLGYEGRAKGLGELTLGVQRVDYQKNVVRPDGIDPPTKTDTWLFNAGAAITVSPTFAIYAGYARGLEESPVAPSYAANRDEAPPAILTRQYDAGIRWNLFHNVKLISGVFDVEKPYFSLDKNNVYRQLGDVRHRGVELSLVGEPLPHLNVVAGAILLDAVVSGEQVDSGVIGKRPVGTAPRTILLSGDYEIPGLHGVSVDLTLMNQGREAANSANSVFVPPSTTVDAGVRYATHVAGKAVSLRLQASNLLNNYSWYLMGSNAFFYSDQRRVTFRVATDL